MNKNAENHRKGLAKRIKGVYNTSIIKLRECKARSNSVSEGRTRIWSE